MSRLALAVDLGGTKVEAALVDEHGQVLPGSRSRRPTGPRVRPDLLEGAIVQIVRTVLSGASGPVVGIGIGSAGPIDHEAGTVFPVNLPGVHGLALREMVARAAAYFGAPDVPVRLGHDGGCLALAESWIGATRDARASMAIVVSTGVGGGFILDGSLVTGAGGNAGHLGQTRGGEGHTLEQIASGPASVAWANDQGWVGSTGEDLGAAAASGDAIARAAIERSARAVGQALADAATLMDLEVIAVGGGFSHVSQDYIDLVGHALTDAAVLPYAQSARVVPSGLHGDGPLVGAAALVMGPAATP